MVAEEEILLSQPLEAVRQALYKTINKQLGKQRQLLKESEHWVAQETHSRQQLDSMKYVKISKCKGGYNVFRQQQYYDPLFAMACIPPFQISKRS
ncbi:UNVERIFIED_CONTAM: hypothetical protein FKN15_026191 [Acipenser sinensis]